MFTNHGVVYQHLIIYLSFNGISKIPEGFIFERWKVLSRSLIRMASGKMLSMHISNSMICDLCTRLMAVGHEGEEDFVVGIVIFPIINSITRCETPRNGTIQISVPTIVRKKGSGQGGRPPNSSKWFKRTR